MDRTTLPQQTRDLIQQVSLMRNEVCCKLRELNENIVSITGSTGSPTDLLSGMAYLTGTDSFTTSTPLLGGTDYQSVSLSVISLTTGQVTVTDDSGTTNISFPGFSTGWSVNKITDKGVTGITISTTGDAKVLVTYTIK